MLITSKGIEVLKSSCDCDAASVVEPYCGTVSDTDVYARLNSEVIGTGAAVVLCVVVGIDADLETTRARKPPSAAHGNKGFANVLLVTCCPFPTCAARKRWSCMRSTTLRTVRAGLGCGIGSCLCGVVVSDT
jgi:hypothetical protein